MVIYKGKNKYFFLQNRRKHVKYILKILQKNQFIINLNLLINYLVYMKYAYENNDVRKYITKQSSRRKKLKHYKKNLFIKIDY